MVKEYNTTSYKQTQKLGEKFAKEILNVPSKKSALVLCLNGNLGGGKTTFLQGFAKGLGVKEKILSPTFVILKHFQILNTKFTGFYHIDCYRFEKSEEILGLGFKEIISDSKNVVAIEWPEKIKEFLPKGVVAISFKFIDNNKREIKISKNF